MAPSSTLADMLGKCRIVVKEKKPTIASNRRTIPKPAVSFIFRLIFLIPYPPAIIRATWYPLLSGRVHPIANIGRGIADFRDGGYVWRGHSCPRRPAARIT